MVNQGSSRVARTKIAATVVPQWLKNWELGRQFWHKGAKHPPKQFYMFSLPARQLQNLSSANIRVADPESPHRNQTGHQRKLREDRLGEITRFINSGFPYSTLGIRDREKPSAVQAIRPGWLPTAVVLNILEPGTRRRGDRILSDEDAAKVIDSADGSAHIELPAGSDSLEWRPKDGSLPPFEIIDGQHRLEAASKSAATDSYHIPVVAFNNLHASWEAYLFWTINIKPQKIDRSLAFDLFPMLRAESWLELNDQVKLYRETRAQEIVNILWEANGSPWRHRINLLGDRGQSKLGQISQAAWVRSLMDTFYRSKAARKPPRGGLYTVAIDDIETAAWSLPQEAAFIAWAGASMRREIVDDPAEWAKELEMHSVQPKDAPEDYHLAGDSPDSLLNRDMGNTVFLQVLNEVALIKLQDLNLFSWKPFEAVDEDANDSLFAAEIDSFSRHEAAPYFVELGRALARFDWRLPKKGGMDPEESRRRAAYRGSAGYSILHDDVIDFLADKEPAFTGVASKIIEGDYGGVA